MTEPSILSTKLFTPAFPPRGIHRQSLIANLHRGLEERRILTLVSAPAGYGKSTLLAEWISAFQSDAAWLSLDERDNSPLRFWTYLASALQTVSKPLGEAMLSILKSAQPFDPPAFLTALVNEAAALNRRIILILDDYHVISRKDIHQDMIFLLEHLPPSLHLVISTRTDPPFPLSRLRVRGHLTEVRLADLRFTVDESTRFFNSLLNMGLDPAEVEALELRTEGWVAGLQLAALSLQGRSDTHAFIREFTGSQHFVLEYLVDEVLQRQPEQLQQFLLETSILERMNAPLCDAVTETTGSTETLEDLRRRNLFVIPLDGEHRWLRYHHLFAEFLKGHLKRTRSDQIPLLHRRAAAWFQENGLPEEALQHAFAIPDYSCVSRLVIDHWRRVYHKGRLDTAVRWLESLPGDLLRQSPPLGVAYCWTLFIRGDYERIDSYLKSIKQAFEKETATKEPPVNHPEYHIIRHQVALLGAVVLRHRGNPAEAIAEISKLLPAIEELRETLGETYLHMGLTACYSQLGYACAAAHDFDGAEEYLSRVSPHARECGNIFTLAHATMEWALISLARGRVAQAEEICRRELALAEQLPGDDYPAFCLIELALADVLRASHREEEAGEYLDRGLERAAESGHEYYLARGYLIAGRLHHAQNKPGRVQEDIQRAEQIAVILHNRFLNEDIRLTKEGLSPGKLPVQPLIEPLSDRELEVLRLICQGKSNREIAEELFLALDTVKRHANNLYGKLGVSRRTQAVNEARRMGLT